VKRESPIHHKGVHLKSSKTRHYTSKIKIPVENACIDKISANWTSSGICTTAAKEQLERKKERKKKNKRL
jgi:hypothetical protein